ncbi:MAG: hypothetical protein ABI254_11760 [Chthoniobacterales bacterium]
MCQILRCFAFCVVAFGICSAVFAGDEDLSAKQIEKIEMKSLSLLRDVMPASSPMGFLHKQSRPLKIMKTPEGTVWWGNLFTKEEIVALVNLAPAHEEEPGEHLPRYLSFFAWQKGKWVFRQFLGNVYNLGLNYRNDVPSSFLQGSRRIGRNTGDHLSWYYDVKTGRLIRTHFENWGPFRLAGNYLCLTRGFEAHLHDATIWIYEYKDGRKGEFLARFHSRDDGSSDVVFRDHKSHKMVGWYFNGSYKNGNYENGNPISVNVREIKDIDNLVGAKIRVGDDYDDEESRQIMRGEMVVEGVDYAESIPSAEFFEILTGLNPGLLDTEWQNELSAPPPLKRSNISVTGNPEIVKRFQWPKENHKTP